MINLNINRLTVLLIRIIMHVNMRFLYISIFHALLAFIA